MKRIISIIMILSLTLSLNLFVFADKNPEKLDNKEYTLINIEEPEGICGFKYKFIDEDLKNSVNNSCEISTMGELHEEYAYSYYVVGNKTLTKYNCGPINDRTFLISAARGQTVYLEETKEVSGTVTYSGTVGVEIKRVINVDLTSEISGSYTKTWKEGMAFNGPDSSSPYSSRDFYGAIDYDLYNCRVDRYDVFKIYNGEIDTGETNTYFHSSESVNNVKKPKSIQYSLDYNRE